MGTDDDNEDVAVVKRALRVLGSTAKRHRYVDASNHAEHLRVFMQCMALYIRSGRKWPDYSLPWCLDEYVWHELILDTENYESICRVAHEKYNVPKYPRSGPYAVAHSPLRGCEKDINVVLQRRANLNRDYQTYFREPLRGIFTASTLPMPVPASSSPSPNDEQVHLTIRGLDGKNVCITAFLDAPCARFMQAYCAIRAIPMCDDKMPVFLYQGKMIMEEHTCRDYGLTADSVIHAVIPMRGC